MNQIQTVFLCHAIPMWLAFCLWYWYQCHKRIRARQRDQAAWLMVRKLRKKSAGAA